MSKTDDEEPAIRVGGSVRSDSGYAGTIVTIIDVDGDEIDEPVPASEAYRIAALVLQCACGCGAYITVATCGGATLGPSRPLN